MGEWADFTPGNLFPTELEAAVAGTSTIVGVLDTTLNTVAGVIDFVGNFVTGFSDYNAVAIETAQALIESAVSQFNQSGIYVISHIPTTPGIASDPQSWLRTISNSLNDTFDKNRPELTDPGAFVGGIVALATASDYRTLMQNFSGFFKAFDFNLPKIGQLEEMIIPEDIENPDTNIELSQLPGNGESPDWESLNLMDIIPGIGTVTNALLDFSNKINAARGASDIYSTFADILRDKANQLSEFSSIVTQTLNDITTALAFTGVHVLPIYGQGDITFVQEQLLNSTGGPLDLGDAQYSAGFMFLASAGTTAPRDLLFDFFGLAKENT